MRTQRFQNRVTAGRFTLPVAILLSVACWILSAILLPDLDVQKDNYPCGTRSATHVFQPGVTVFPVLSYTPS